MYSEDDLLPISALQHLVFCERQWGLIHLEGIWSENLLTAQGRVLHERTHQEGVEMDGDVLISRGLSVRSLTLGLTGKTDVVEFHPAMDRDGGGVRLPGKRGLWRVFPVEYKRGRPKPDLSDEVQVCAQALCLEEMLGAPIDAAAIFYGQPRRRHEVPLTPQLKQKTIELTRRLHDLTRAGRTPVAPYEKKCRNCSLLDDCLPRITGDKRRVAAYFNHMLAETGENTDEADS